MTQEERNEILRHIEVEKAYLDGKAIELKSVGGATWTLVDWKPSWNWAEILKKKPLNGVIEWLKGGTLRLRKHPCSFTSYAWCGYG